MREKMISLIIEMVGNNSARDHRWQPAREYMARLHGVDPETKAGQKFLKDVEILIADRSILSNMDNDMLFEYFELIRRRFYIQM